MSFYAHYPCPACGSSDALGVGIDSEGVYYGKCFSCEKPYHNNTLAELFPEEGIPLLKENNNKVVKNKPTKRLTKQEYNDIIANTTEKGKSYRGIRDEILQQFGVRTGFSQDGGKVANRYYPVTRKGKLCGWKRRTVIPKKDFRGIGLTGKTTDLFGQSRFKSGYKTCLIVGGEEDQLISVQMLLDNAKKRNSKYGLPCAVVSPSTSETAALDQVKNNYQYFDQFDKIIIGFDSDEKGREWAEKIAEVLPKGRVHIAIWPEKDPCDCHKKGRSDEFIQAYWGARKWTPTGVVGSSKLHESIVKSLGMKKIPLPGFMHKLQNLMAGGIPLGYIINIGADTGIGKTSVVNEMIYKWIFDSPYLIGIVSLELDQGQYGTALLSRHIGKKISLIEDPDVAVEFVSSEVVSEKSLELFSKITEETGEIEDRFLLVDDRDGQLESLQEKVEEMIISSGVKLIILDPLQDILDGLSIEDQTVFMRWQKQMIKSHNVTFINISHLKKRRIKDDEGNIIEPQEGDMYGSGSIAKSAGANILLWRDKDSEDDLKRNTTYVKMPKCRWTGQTGYSGEWVYDNETHTLWDKNEYLSKKMTTQEHQEDSDTDE